MTRLLQVIWAAFIAGVVLDPALVAAQEWTRFRGPNGAGQSDAEKIPTKWTEKDYNWKADLPGTGHSSPVLWGKKLFITSGDPATGEVHVLRLDADTGAEVWRNSYLTSNHHLHARNSYASATPCVDAERIYLPVVTPEQYSLVALDHNGEKVWRADLGPFNSEHGFGASPMIYKDLVVIANDQKGSSFLVAIRRDSGEVAWKTERTKFVRTAYGTPCVYTPAGGEDELIFTSGANGVTSVDPTSGKVNWQVEPFDKRSVSSPVIAGGLVFGTCGSGGGGNFVVAVRPGEKNGQAAEVVYKIDRSAPYVPTSVAAGDLLFLWYDKGIVTCLDAPSGKVHYQQRVGGNFSGSPIRIGDRIYCISEDGECYVIAADKKFKLLAKNPLGDLSRATPSVAGGRLFLRTYGSLISLGGE
jgi:outer membrane protein assembly factor BamB